MHRRPKVPNRRPAPTPAVRVTRPVPVHRKPPPQQRRPR
jgi:hypothetical protein